MPNHLSTLLQKKPHNEVWKRGKEAVWSEVGMVDENGVGVVETN